MTKFTLSILVTFLLNAQFLVAQHKEEHNSEILEKHEFKNEVSLIYGSTYIFKSGFNIPTIGFDYMRKINHYFSIGALVDFELGSHVIVYELDGDEIEVDREGAVLLMPGVSFRIVKGLTAFTGYGMELEKNETLGLFKLGMSYKLKLINDRWSTNPYFCWDHTRLYDGLLYGASFGFEFGN